jgi:hypothetical protein
MKKAMKQKIRLQTVAALLLSANLCAFWISGNAIAKSLPELNAELEQVVKLRQEYENYYEDLKNNRIVVMPTKDKPPRYVALDGALLYAEIERLVRARAKADPSIKEKRDFILNKAPEVSLWMFDQIVKAQANDLRNFMQFADSQAEELEKKEADLRRRIGAVRAGGPDPGPGAAAPSLPDNQPTLAQRHKNLRDQLAAEWNAKRKHWMTAITVPGSSPGPYHTGVAIPHIDLAVVGLPLQHEGLPKLEERVARVKQAIQECDVCIVAKNNERMQLNTEYDRLKRSVMDEQPKAALMRKNRDDFNEAGNYITDLTGTVAACRLRGKKITPVSRTYRVPSECIAR